MTPTPWDAQAIDGAAETIELQPRQPDKPGHDEAGRSGYDGAMPFAPDSAPLPSRARTFFDFWFGSPDDPKRLDHRQIWFRSTPEFDAAVRAKGLAALRTAIDDAKFYGADTVLLVPGKVSNKETENYEQCYARSQEEIRKVLPQAADANTKIAIEVVWNDFITKPEQLVEYVDAFQSPSVGAYFDCSNMLKYGVPAATWIRTLGKRMLKFDFKGYSHKKKWVAIGDGDEDWPEVLKALDEIGYHGWATSEVSGGGEAELREIAQRMNHVLGLS